MSGLIDHIKEMCAGLEAVQFKRMFGGWALVSPDGMFGLVAGDVLYLKSDAVNAATYEAEGLEPFSYATRDGRRTMTSYRRAPERVFDDPEEFRWWAAEALAATARVAAARPKGRAPGSGEKGPRKRLRRAQAPAT